MDVDMLPKLQRHRGESALASTTVPAEYLGKFCETVYPFSALNSHNAAKSIMRKAENL
jgi:hypothetical protein